MARLCEYYGVSDSYSNLKKIRIVRVRYQMTREQFSIYNNYTMATTASCMANTVCGAQPRLAAAQAMGRMLRSEQPSMI